jgi:hypothetical protein
MHLGLPIPCTASLHACPCCGQPMAYTDIPDHLTACGRGGGRQLLHTTIMRVVRSILEEAGEFVEVELGGIIEGTNRRPGDITAMGFTSATHHLVIDVASVTVMCGTHVAGAAVTAGSAARAKERDKFAHSAALVRRAGHRFVPFVVEQYGRLGVHAQALLRELADRTIAAGRFRHCDGRSRDASRAMLLSMWRSRISVAFRAAQADIILRRSQEAACAPDRRISRAMLRMGDVVAAAGLFGVI